MKVQTEYLMAEITLVEETYRFEVIIKAHALQIPVEEHIEALEFKWEKGNLYTANFDPEHLDDLIAELTSGVNDIVDSWLRAQEEEREGKPDYGVRNIDFIAY